MYTYHMNMQYNVLIYNTSLPHMHSTNTIYILEPFLLGTIRLKFLMEKVPNCIAEKIREKSVQ